jgi:chromosome segregation ATPase
MAMMAPQVQASDVQGLLALAKFCTDPDAKKVLIDLAAQKAAIDAAIKEQLKIQQANEKTALELGAGLAALEERTKDLDVREGRLEEDKREYARTIDADRKNDDQVAQARREFFNDKAKALDERQAELNKQAANIAQQKILNEQRTAVLNGLEKSLSEQRAKLETAQKAHAAKVAAIDAVVQAQRNAL